MNKKYGGIMKKYANNIYFLYTIVFILIFTIGIIPLNVSNNTVFGLGYFKDEIKQHLVFMYDYVNEIKTALFSGGKIQLYRYNLGLGSDFVLSYTYYSLFDPLTIIAYIIPLKYIEVSYYLLIVIRLYLSGVFIILLAKKFAINNKYALLGVGIFYTFNVTVLYTALRHPMFINGPMLLPLIILGAEKIIRNESPFLLIFTAFYALIAQFYFFVYACFAFELFVLLRIWGMKENKLKIFLRTNLIFLLGSLLGSFVLVPQLVAVLTGSRIGSKGFISFGGIELGGILSSFYIPVVGRYYSSGLGNIFVLFVVITYIANNNNKTWEARFFIITSLLIFISYFGYAINAFTYVNNRWSYIMNLPAALILGKVIANNSVEDEAINMAGKFIIYGICLIFVLFLMGIINIYIGVLVAMGLALLLYMPFNKINFTKLKKLFNYKMLTKLTLVTSFVITILTAISYVPQTTSEGLSGYGDKASYEVILEDEDFFRVDQEKYLLNTNNLSNDNIIHGYNATYFYNTMASGGISEVIKYFNVVNDNNTVGYNGFNLRSGLNAINSVKYIIVRDSENIEIPYGFIPYEHIKLEKFIPDKFNYCEIGYISYKDGKPEYEDATIYLNTNFVNFGFVYDNYYLEAEIENFNHIEKESLLLDGVILDEEIEGLNKGRVSNKINFVEVLDYKTNNLLINNGFIKAYENGGQIEFLIENIAGHELYLEIKDIENTQKNEAFTLTYKANNHIDKVHNYEYGTNFYIDNSHHLLNMGYYNNEDVLVEIDFPEGEYKFNQISYYLNPVEGISDKIEKLNNHHLENLEFNEAGFTGEITLEEKGMLFISLPYSDGFTAFVDGEETKIYKANIGYMGIEVNSGNHNIEFVYKTPGMSLGVNISILALIFVVIIFWYYMNEKRKRKEQNEKNSEYTTKVF